MTYNILAYIIYLAMMVFIIVYVGKRFFTHGRIFIHSFFPANPSLADQLNKTLLIAYYLFNIGYAFIQLKYWEKVNTIQILFSTIAIKMATLIMILAITHYFNMTVIYILSKSKIFSITHKHFHS